MSDEANVMIKNLEANTGKSLAEWIKIALSSGEEKHRPMLNFLKDNHGLTYGFANLVAMKARKADAGSVENQDDLITEQYAKKPELKPIYDSLMKQIQAFGKDVEIAPKKAYVSLRHKKQFGIIQPSTKTRLDVGINLKGTEPTDRLEASGSFNAMVSHRVRVTDIKQVDDELVAWLKAAFDAAG